jgi:hypothetical protein
LRFSLCLPDQSAKAALVPIDPVGFAGENIVCESD